MTRVSRLALALATATLLSAAALAQTAATAPAADASKPMAQPAPEMKAVLDKLTALGAKPIGTQSVEETRKGPTPADAAMAVMKEKGIQPDAAFKAVKTRDLTIPGAGGPIPVRIYTPEGTGPFPIVVYFHGGGWVIADIDTYDASARGIAAGAKAVVVSADYRHAPEHKFPAAHEDANAAYKWAIENSGSFNGDAKKVALVGESAGGNLAANVAITARDQKLTAPLAEVLVYPVAGKDMTTPSYVENAEAMPLSKKAMEWFVSNVFESKQQAADPRLDLVNRSDLAGLPPTTIINAEIDPLRSEGEMLAGKLKAAGVATEQKTYAGVTHEFFGMAAVVPQAKDATAMAVAALTKAFAN
ncbi:alpha/beta hydrolase [Aureimonas sp. AU40]|uniref:alpha/beta hydrolase n=1 Tax=Aureimonas sp. AU40 TaxID=1637747 RepID=UPI000781A4A5|nr:alpha/beta hydrolase [Aureimonas sp. AU40]